MIAALWGVFIWKEFTGSSKSTGQTFRNHVYSVHHRIIIHRFIRRKLIMKNEPYSFPTNSSLLFSFLSITVAKIIEAGSPDKKM